MRGFVVFGARSQKVQFERRRCHFELHGSRWTATTVKMEAKTEDKNSKMLVLLKTFSKIFTDVVRRCSKKLNQAL